MLAVPGLPFPLAPSHPEVWRCDGEDGAVVAAAPAHTDFYINPGGAGSVDAETLLNAATLIGTPPEGDFQFSARVRVGFRAQYDAGVLLVWIDERNWAKFCFEFSPAHEPMVVSVVTRGVSDDANAFVVAERSIRLRISRLDDVYAFHAATDARTWQLIRLFNLGDGVHDHKIGFEAQSPVGEGCTVTFTETRFLRQRLADLRDGS
jgi:regulation of enolase protein 1 (concanavalin A-like superfamily)